MTGLGLTSDLRDPIAVNCASVGLRSITEYING